MIKMTRILLAIFTTALLAAQTAHADSPQLNGLYHTGADADHISSTCNDTRDNTRPPSSLVMIDEIYGMAGQVALANNWLPHVGTTTPAMDGCPWQAANQQTTNELPTVMVPVPEPETYAMLLAGLGLMGFVAHRRKRDNT